MRKKKNRFPLVMKSVAGICAAATAIFVVLHQFFPWEWLVTAAISTGTTCYHFSMRLAVGNLVPKATGYAFDYKSAWFQPRKWEASFYKSLNIKDWKGSLPTYSPDQFSLEINSVHRVIQNMCGAEVVHEIIMLCSFLPLLFVFLFGAFPVFLITSVLAALYDSIFVMAQRYNRPRLVRIFEKQEAKRS